MSDCHLQECNLYLFLAFRFSFSLSFLLFLGALLFPAQTSSHCNKIRTPTHIKIIEHDEISEEILIEISCTENKEMVFNH